MSKLTVLPDSVEMSIAKRIEQIFKNERLDDMFPNALLRDDVLELLDHYCTVIYYPLQNEENNGFHITNVPFADGTKHNFVFVNTAQTMEKQVFTAAHELGHIWAIDEFVINDLHLEDSFELREMIISRFAAVLLIPREFFSRSVAFCFSEYGNYDGTISLINLLKMVVNLMNQFFVPMKAIILRLVEMRFFSMDMATCLLEGKESEKSEIDRYVQEFIDEFGFTKLRNASMKKWIEGLSEKLEMAESKHLASQAKINHMRETFSLKPPSFITARMKDLISFSG